MDGIDKITSRINADVDREIAEIQARAAAEAAQIAAEYDRRCAQETEEVLSRGRRAAEEREERLASVAQLEARKLVLAAKQEMVGKAFDKALADLAALPDEQYVALLADLAVKASRTGREQVIFSQKDRSRFGKAVVTRANEILARQVAPKLPDELTETKAGAVLDKVVTGASAVLAGTGMLTMAEETRPMAGGLILRDDKVETNCSFEVLIHLQKEDLAAEVARALFE